MKTLVIIISIGVAVFIAAKWYKAWNKPSGKSKGSVDMPDENNKQGDQNI